MNRERQARWDAAHLQTVGTKLSRKECRTLEYVCGIEGISRYALLRWLILEWLREYAEENPAAMAAHFELPSGK